MTYDLIVNGRLICVGKTDPNATFQTARKSEFPSSDS